MNTLIACHGCDLLVDLSTLRDGDRAICPRCNGFLTRVRDDALSVVFACTISGMIFLAVANAFPFLSFSSSGLESAMTLPQAALALYDYDMPLIALMVAAFIILIPAMVLLLLLLLCGPLYWQRRAVWLVTTARWLFSLKNWAMVEVFIIGVIVALVKLSTMATVTIGISFWAYIAFSLCFTMALAGLDRYQCWQLIEQLDSPR